MLIGFYSLFFVGNLLVSCRIFSLGEILRVPRVHIVAGNDDEGLSSEELILIGLLSILNGDY